MEDVELNEVHNPVEFISWKISCTVVWTGHTSWIDLYAVVKVSTREEAALIEVNLCVYFRFERRLNRHCIFSCHLYSIDFDASSYSTVATKTDCPWQTSSRASSRRSITRRQDSRSVVSLIAISSFRSRGISLTLTELSL